MKKKYEKTEATLKPRKNVGAIHQNLIFLYQISSFCFKFKWFKQ